MGLKTKGVNTAKPSSNYNFIFYSLSYVLLNVCAITQHRYKTQQVENEVTSVEIKKKKQCTFSVETGRYTSRDNVEALSNVLYIIFI